jgi:small subunit ribosomal protein S2
MNNFESKTVAQNNENNDENVFLRDNIFNKIINLDHESNKSELIETFMNLDVHYGHRTNAWNPLMSRYLFAEHGGVHILDLTKTIYLLKNVLNDLIKLFSENNARILFIGSKEQLTETIKSEANRCGQYYVNYRWFGGTLTNWGTIQKSIKKMDMIEREIYENRDQMNKRELASRQRVLTKLENSLGGIRKMSNLPDIIFVTDTKKEKVAIAEANKLGIPVIALLDSNSNPRGIDYPIPCNDDNQRAVGLIAQLIADAVLVGMEISFSKKEAASKERNKLGNSQNKRKSFVRSGSIGSSNSIEKETSIDKNLLSDAQNQEELFAQFEKEGNPNNNSEKQEAITPKSNTSIQAKLKKSFIAPQKNNAKIGGGFSSAASLLKKTSITKKQPNDYSSESK